jgi:hypothetical protein
MHMAPSLTFDKEVQIFEEFSVNQLGEVDCACSSSTDMGITSTATTPLHGKIQQRKSISFNPYPLIHEVLSRSDYSCDEVHSTWYDRDEVAMIKAELKENAIVLASSSRAGGSCRTSSAGRTSFCKRGLEWVLLSGDQRWAKAEAQKAVLEEQALQRYEGVSDCELLADIYFDVSHESQAMAQTAAQQDEIEDARDECMRTTGPGYSAKKDVVLSFVRAALPVNACNQVNACVA